MTTGFATALGMLYPDQVTTNQLTQNIVYISGTVGALVIVAGLLLIDLGGVRRRNMLDSVLQKIIAFFIGFTVYFLIGFAIWNWQYNVAFEVESPYLQSIKDWWMGGTLSTALAQNTDPALGFINNQQIFIFFLACFAGIINVLVGIAVTERIKPAAYFVIAAVLPVVSSLLAWITWGSTGPLTNAGFHDFFGVAFVYMFSAGVAVALLRGMPPRLGQYRPHPGAGEYRSYNLGMVAVGVVMIFGGLPFVIVSCGFFFPLEQGESTADAFFVSVNMSDTSVGVALNNLAMAFAGGTLAGALIAYRTKEYIYVLLGPLAGYVAGAPGFDVYSPPVMFLVAIGAAVVAWGVYAWLQRREIDEHKLIPLFLGAGFYGMLALGVINWGTKGGGYFGLTEGPYAFQNAEITPWVQLAGAALCVAVGLITGAVLRAVLERTTGFFVTDDVQVDGYDRRYWEIVHDDGETVVETVSVISEPVSRTPA